MKRKRPNVEKTLCTAHLPWLKGYVDVGGKNRDSSLTSVSSCCRRASSASRLDLAVARASLVLSMATLSTMRACAQRPSMSAGSGAANGWCAEHQVGSTMHMSTASSSSSRCRVCEHLLAGLVGRGLRCSPVILARLQWREALHNQGAKPM